jgi:hypothetical protein
VNKTWRLSLNADSGYELYLQQIGMIVSMQISGADGGIAIISGFLFAHQK